MEISMNVTLDDDATPTEIAAAMRFASDNACAMFRERKTRMLVNESCDLNLTDGKLQNVTLHRFD